MGEEKTGSERWGVEELEIREMGSELRVRDRTGEAESEGRGAGLGQGLRISNLNKVSKEMEIRTGLRQRAGRPC